MIFGKLVRKSLKISMVVVICGDLFLRKNQKRLFIWSLKSSKTPRQLSNF